MFTSPRTLVFGYPHRLPLTLPLTSPSQPQQAKLILN